MKKAHTIILPFSNVTTVIKFKSYGNNNKPAPPPLIRKYGTYHPAEVGPVVSGFDETTGTVEEEGMGPKAEYIAWFENNAPAMPEHLWKKREQLTIAEKRIFDAIIELPPMDKKEAVSKIAEHTGISKSTVNWHRNTIMAMIDEEELREAV